MGVITIEEEKVFKRVHEFQHALKVNLRSASAPILVQKNRWNKFVASPLREMTPEEVKTRLDELIRAVKTMGEWQAYGEWKRQQPFLPLPTAWEKANVQKEIIEAANAAHALVI